MKKCLTVFQQVCLCNQNPDKREKVTSTSDPPLCPIPITVLHCITTLLTSNSTGSFFKTLYCCNPVVYTASPFFCLMLFVRIIYIVVCSCHTFSCLCVIPLHE